MTTCHIIVHGHVQGVGFRFYTKREADRLGVNGWVKNRPDGTVEIVAQSDKTTLQHFIAAVKTGSPASRVGHVHVDEKPEIRRYRSFQVRH